MKIFDLLFRCIWDPITFILMIVVVIAMICINVSAQKKIDKAIAREQEEREEIKKILEEMPSLETL